MRQEGRFFSCTFSSLPGQFPPKYSLRCGKMHLNFSKKDMRGCKWKSVLWGVCAVPAAGRCTLKVLSGPALGAPPGAESGRPVAAQRPQHAFGSRGPQRQVRPRQHAGAVRRGLGHSPHPLHAEQAVGSRGVRDTSPLRQARSAAFTQIRAYKLVRPPLQK